MTDLDKINQGLHEQIRDKDGLIFKLRENIDQLRASSTFIEIEGPRGVRHTISPGDQFVYEVKEFGIRFEFKTRGGTKAELPEAEPPVAASSSELIAKLQRDIADKNAAIDDIAKQRDALQSHVDRQGHLLYQACSLLESAVAEAKAAQDEAGEFHEKMDACEAALAEARSQRDYNAKVIDQRDTQVAALNQKVERLLDKISSLSENR